ncbi:hypothetical protein ACOSQ2_031440 [Xanthoceras sorbifolium]
MLKFLRCLDDREAGSQPFALKIRCFCHYALISESNEMMSLKGHGQEPELFNPIGHPAGRKSSVLSMRLLR